METTKKEPACLSANECYALVFDNSRDALMLRNVRAVISIGKLTDEQYRRVPDEFERHYTRTNHVIFVLEQTDFAHLVFAIDSAAAKIPPCTIEALDKQKDLHDDIRWVLDLNPASLLL